MDMIRSRYSKLTMVMVLLINESMVSIVNANQSERWNRIHRSDLAGGGHASREGVQDKPPRDRKTRATHVFDALVERSVGRYILATSSLAGECVRAYVPGPFGLMTSLLCTRVRDALFSREHDVLGPDDGQSSRLSYKRFLSPEGDTDDYLDRLPESFESAIQYKYSRVSAAFLVRHGIGHAIAADDEIGLGSTNQDRAKTKGRYKLAELDERMQDAPSSRVEEKAASYSIINSLNNFRKMRRTVIEDDLDLLSEDLEDEDHLKEPPRVVGSTIKERGGNKAVKITTGVSQRPPNDVRVRREGLGTLNLISNGDEGAIKLVNKLRGAHAGPKIGAEKVGYGDSTRREKGV